MKPWLILLVMMLLSRFGHAQDASFSSIDWNVQNIEAKTPDSLAQLLTRNHTTELAKVRAIYSWITNHIAYNMDIFRRNPGPYKYSPDPLDTSAVWPSGDEMIARKVLRKRVAVCDGYSRLFKVMCSYAGIEAEIVQGYGRVNGGGDKKFRTNHTWNAVRIDSAWKLLDITWASGYTTYADDFVQKQNDFYFLTPPDQFITDHYPEELRWTLLANPPAPYELKKLPFRSKNFFKYGVNSYFPQSGIIEAAEGDTILFSVQLKDVARAKTTSADPFMDTLSYSQWPLSSFVKAGRENGNFVYYSYVAEPAAEWINLLYNDDVIMRYRINVSIKKEAVNTVSLLSPN
ncbi:MAG: hypothetical protein JWR72_647 [Flavisolibacter sp.]|jgi:transglutaminase/protease-like cytokinesis protein 3|nr:hypothetical protein [Flavisolibacter sp.]